MKIKNSRVIIKRKLKRDVFAKSSNVYEIYLKNIFKVCLGKYYDRDCDFFKKENKIFTLEIPTLPLTPSGNFLGITAKTK